MITPSDMVKVSAKPPSFDLKSYGLTIFKPLNPISVTPDPFSHVITDCIWKPPTGTESRLTCCESLELLEFLQRNESVLRAWAHVEKTKKRETLEKLKDEVLEELAKS